MGTISDALRRAVENTRESRNALAARSGVSAATISRFMAGQPITTENADALAAALRVRVMPATKTKATKGGR